MKFWITKRGTYYEADYRLRSTDIEIKIRRPGDQYYYYNGEWHQFTTDDDEEEELPPPDNDKHSGIYRMRLKPEHERQHYHPQGYQQPMQYCPPMQQYQQQQQIQPQPQQQETQKKDDGLVLNNNTRVMFGIKELLMVGTFVVTATISWQDSNTRLLALESKIKTLEAEVKRLDQTTRDLDTIVLMMKGNNAQQKH